MEEEVHKNISDLSDKDVQKILRKDHPELFVMLPDLQSKLQSLSTTLQPLVDALHQPSSLSPLGEEYTDTKIQTYLNYCILLSNYLLLKSEQVSVREHPIMQALVKAR